MDVVAKRLCPHPVNSNVARMMPQDCKIKTPRRKCLFKDKFADNSNLKSKCPPFPRLSARNFTYTNNEQAPRQRYEQHLNRTRGHYYRNNQCNPFQTPLKDIVASNIQHFSENDCNSYTLRYIFRNMCQCNVATLKGLLPSYKDYDNMCCKPHHRLNKQRIMDDEIDVESARILDEQLSSAVKRMRHFYKRDPYAVNGYLCLPRNCRPYGSQKVPTLKQSLPAPETKYLFRDQIMNLSKQKFEENKDLDRSTVISSEIRPETGELRDVTSSGSKYLDDLGEFPLDDINYWSSLPDLNALAETSLLSQESYDTIYQEHLTADFEWEETMEVFDENTMQSLLRDIVFLDDTLQRITDSKTSIRRLSDLLEYANNYGTGSDYVFDEKVTSQTEEKEGSTTFETAEANENQIEVETGGAMGEMEIGGVMGEMEIGGAMGEVEIGGAMGETEIGGDMGAAIETDLSGGLEFTGGLEANEMDAAMENTRTEEENANNYEETEEVNARSDEETEEVNARSDEETEVNARNDEETEEVNVGSDEETEEVNAGSDEYTPAGEMNFSSGQENATEENQE